MLLILIQLHLLQIEWNVHHNDVGKKKKSKEALINVMTKICNALERFVANFNQQTKRQDRVVGEL